MDAKGWWTSQLGAFFFANIGDTDGLCSKSLVAPAPPEKNENGTIFDHSSERYLDECHNASDNVLRNPEYLAPLRTLANCKGLSDTATVHVEDDDAAAKFRIFFKQDDDNWIYIAANHTFSAQGIKKGLELGIDARDVRRSTWDGRVQVHFTVRSAGNGVRDHVALRVAPVLTHHHGQRTERTITTAGRWNDSQARFVAEFQQNVARAGINEPVFLFTDDDIWTPDSFEPGYTSIPGPNGPIILRIMINSIRSHQDAGHKIFTRLRSAGVGAVQQLGEGGTLDATGNLETVPPHTFNNVSYLAGCVIMGTFKSKKPLMLPFLNAQETQKRIELDTDWLSVGHVDEFLQFLPVDNEHGWVLMADDPIAGLETSRKLLRVMPLLWQFRGRVFPLQNITEVTHYVAERIQHNFDILKRETGLQDEDIFRVPALFHNNHTGGFECSNNGSSNTTSTAQLVAKDTMIGGPAAQAKPIVKVGMVVGKTKHGKRDNDVGISSKVVALYPGTINGVVLTESLVTQPMGPCHR